MRAPSIKSLKFAGFTPEQSKTIRAAFLKGIDTDRPRAAMVVCDEIIGSHGVETITYTYQDNEYHLYYCNKGDTYDITILWDDRTGNFSVGSWGDFVEYGERRGMKFA